jgi:methenyltetrahydromethanopterin cyclohydrolase
VNLNDRAVELCTQLVAHRARLRIAVSASPGGTQIIDCGIEACGGLEAGRRLAEICLAGLGRVELLPTSGALAGALQVLVTTDHPVAACMASQYAGWQITGEGYFAMGSGPMRACARQEALYDKIGHHEQAERVVGVLETRTAPPEAICRRVAEDCGVTPEHLTLLVAPTASRAGMVQVVARSVETALHKLFELGFDLARIVSACGTAPLPLVARNDLDAIGRTNDAILYGGEVTLWVRGDDASLEAMGPSVPSSASRDHGEPFAAIFDRYGRDFYKVDPHLFSPAVITFANVDSGRVMRFGHLMSDVIRHSFGL